MNARANIDAEDKNGDTPLRIATGKVRVGAALADSMRGCRVWNADLELGGVVTLGQLLQGGEVETLLRQMGARDHNPQGTGGAATMDYV